MAARGQNAARGKPAAAPSRGREADEHGHVEFHLAKRTSGEVALAVRGLPAGRRARVLDVIHLVAEDARGQGERFVEKNVVGNANELLAAMSVRYAPENRWSELRALWTFLAHLDVPVNHARIARRIEKDAGKEVATRYLEEAG